MKKRTLNQTWILCLRMWRHIAKVWTAGEKVERLKTKWLTENGFVNMDVDMPSGCFFCKYAEAISGCAECPGRLVDLSFSCYRESYSFEHNPPAFYRELLRLNRIRKASNKLNKK